MRPRRVSVLDELGRRATLPDGETAFEVSGSGAGVLVLGLGPDPAGLEAMLGDAERVRYIECPGFEAQMDPNWARAVPDSWERADPSRAAGMMAETGRVVVYARNIRLFPSFWGEVLAACRLPSPPGPEAVSDEVWLPGSDRDLLHLDLAWAFEEAGLAVRSLPEEPDPAETARLLSEGRPRIFFSVNLRGIDPLGEVVHLLRRAGVRTAAWCVDNPYHLLSAMRSPAWRLIDLYVTDHWFIGPLRRDGARFASHLPLAASRSMVDAAPGPGQEYFGDRLVFAGRSRFPGKRNFFAGRRLDPKDWRLAQSMLVRGERPDFQWWVARTGLDALWPGGEVRKAGYGAEESTLAWRSLCLENAAQVPLTVFGDEGWKDVLAGRADLRGAVDYHHDLPSIYAAAGAVLNATSMLLPCGLTNRHFDAPAAGCVALTDDTPGLSIFPDDLLREVVFRRADEIPTLFRRLMAEPSLRSDLARAWREEIRARHGYGARVATVLNQGKF